MIEREQVLRAGKWVAGGLAVAGLAVGADFYIDSQIAEANRGLSDAINELDGTEVQVDLDVDVDLGMVKVEIDEDFSVVGDEIGRGIAEGFSDEAIEQIVRLAIEDMFSE
jgi:hypothetical protein